MSERTQTRIEQQVAKLPRAWAEYFTERSGMHLSDGDTIELADQKAWLETRRAMRTYTDLGVA
jgi:hypothetical protein